MDSITPPPSYQTDVEEMDTSDERDAFQSLIPETVRSRPSSSGGSTPAYPVETDSGVRWRYADPGLTFLSLSSSDASSQADSNPRFVRSQYINGAVCILKGLPADLSLEEVLDLREALPTSLAAPDPADQQIAPRSPRGLSMRAAQYRAAEQSTLHRMTATLTLYAVLFFSFLIPYVQLFFQHTYQFERRHRISDRVLATSFTAADAMGRRTVSIASQVCAMNDGKVGESIKEVGMYLVQGISSGVYDGVGEGMSQLGLRAPEPTTSHRGAGGEIRPRRARPQSSAF